MDYLKHSMNMEGRERSKMKKVRKIVSLFLAIGMMLGMTETVFAAYTAWTVKFLDMTTNTELTETAVYIPTSAFANKLNGYTKDMSIGISSLNKYSMDGTEITVPDGYGFALDQWGPEPATIKTDGTIEIKVKPLVVTYEITLQSEGKGSVQGGGSIEEDTPVTVKAISTADSHFVKWTENGADVSTEATYTFKVSGARTLTAVFEDCMWSSWTGNGDSTHSRTCGICKKKQTENCSGGQGDCLNKPVCGVCGESYAEKGSHTLGTLIPKVDSTYETTGMKAHYECELCKELFDENKEKTTEKALVIARKPKLDWELIFWDTKKEEQVSGSHTSITIPQKFAEALATKDLLWSGTLVDTPLSNLKFDESTLPEDYRLTTTYPSNIPKGATFSKTGITIYVEKITCEAALGVTPEGSGTVEDAGIYEIKTDVTVTAVPNQNYHFVKWIENDKDVSHDASYTFNILSNRNLTAVFEPCNWSEWLSNNNGTHTRTCSVCKITETKPCFGGKATCKEKAVCEMCGGTYGEIDPEHHIAVVKTEAREATHMSAGNIVYWYCSDCEKYFSDEALTQETTLEDTVISKIEHTYKDGKCTVCGAADPNYKPPTETIYAKSDTGSGKITAVAVQTGDTTNLRLPVLTLLVAASGICGVYVSRKKKHLV